MCSALWVSTCVFQHAAAQTLFVVSSCCRPSWSYSEKPAGLLPPIYPSNQQCRFRVCIRGPTNPTNSNVKISFVQGRVWCSSSFASLFGLPQKPNGQGFKLTVCHLILAPNTKTTGLSFGKFPRPVWKGRKELWIRVVAGWLKLRLGHNRACHLSPSVVVVRHQVHGEKFKILELRRKVSGGGPGAQIVQ